MSVIEQLLTVRVSEGPNRWVPADVRKMLYELYHREYEELRYIVDAFKKWIINNTDEYADELFDCIYAGHLGLNADNPYFLYEDCYSATDGVGIKYEGCVMLTRICDQLPLYSKCKVTITPNMMMTIQKYNSDFVCSKQLSM